VSRRQDRCRVAAGGGSPPPPGGPRDLADAGVALGPGLEAAAELEAHIHDLQGRDGLVELDAEVQAGELADAQAGAERATT
jgi:hypothetical protein